MSNGSIVEVGLSRQIFENLQYLYIKCLVGVVFSVVLQCIQVVVEDCGIEMFDDLVDIFFMVCVEGLMKDYKICQGNFCSEVFWVVDDVMFEILWGKIFVFVGELGLGKFMVVKMVLKFEEFISGIIEIDGKDVFVLLNVQVFGFWCCMQFVFQDFYGLFDLLCNIGSMILELLQIYGVGDWVLQCEWIEELLDQVVLLCVLVI